ncbi:MAG TPA: hypothetical protein VG328_00740 [Stellaceae bacterium]|jgi:uncharacterized membrane protein|nr:hypothetical protein [Stellaceae bacterium]
MASAAVLAKQIACVVLIAVAPLAIHYAIATSSWTGLIILIPVLQLLAVAAFAVWREPGRLRWLAPLAVLVVFGTAYAERAGYSLTAMPGVPHALTYLSLLIGFGCTLLPGREALLTRVVVAVRGPMPPAMLRHTRRVTFAWCCFFAAQLIASLLLYVFAPLEIWSFFVNVLNLPLIVLMFVLEGTYRYFRFRDIPLDRWSDISRIVMKSTQRNVGHADIS